LLILDEIQSGIGRTGKLFGFMNYEVVPDILITGKGLGGGMPIGAFVSSSEMMSVLRDKPKLGHITTFGGHPVVAAGALATLKEVCEMNLMDAVFEKERIIREALERHPMVKEIRGTGLMLALILDDPDKTNSLIHKALEQGLILFWLLYEPRAVRITPPLNISEEDLLKGCRIIAGILDELHENLP
jgi:acetylornithine aminotransferase